MEEGGDAWWRHYVGRLDACDAEQILGENEFLVRRDGLNAERMYSPSLDDYVLSYCIRREVEDVSREGRFAEDCGCRPAPLAEGVAKTTALAFVHRRCRKGLASWSEGGKTYQSPREWLRDKVIPQGCTGIDSRFETTRDVNDYEISAFFDDLSSKLAGSTRRRAEACRIECLTSDSMFSYFERAWRDAYFRSTISGPVQKWPQPTSKKQKISTSFDEIRFFDTPGDPSRALRQIATGFLGLEQRLNSENENEDIPLTRQDVVAAYPAEFSA